MILSREEFDNKYENNYLKDCDLFDTIFYLFDKVKSLEIQLENKTTELNNSDLKWYVFKHLFNFVFIRAKSENEANLIAIGKGLTYHIIVAKFDTRAECKKYRLNCLRG